MNKGEPGQEQQQQQQQQIKPQQPDVRDTRTSNQKISNIQRLQQEFERTVYDLFDNDVEFSEDFIKLFDQEEFNVIEFNIVKDHIFKLFKGKLVEPEVVIRTYKKLIEGFQESGNASGKAVVIKTEKELPLDNIDSDLNSIENDLIDNLNEAISEGKITDEIYEKFFF